MKRTLLLITVSLVSSVCAFAASKAKPEPVAPPVPGVSIPLRAAVYISDATRAYDPNFFGHNYQIGQRISDASDAAFHDSFRSVSPLVSFPPAAPLTDADCVVVVDEPVAERGGGMFTVEVTMHATYTVYAPDGRTQIYRSSETMGDKYGGSVNGIRQKISQNARVLAEQFLQKFSATDFVRNGGKLPNLVPVAAQAPAPPPPPQPALLDITSGPSVQVYVNDEFKGITSDEGHLVVSLPAGTYRVRLSEPGKKDFVQPVKLATAERLPVSAQLQSAGPKPLAEQEVENALRNGVPKPRVKLLVAEYGVDFGLDNGVEQRLRDAGADDDLLLAIAKNRKQ